MMDVVEIPIKYGGTILALGAESAGNFSVYKNGKISLSQDFGDLLEQKNLDDFKNSLQNFLKDNSIRPGVILSDLHPAFHTTQLAKNLSKKYGARHFSVQHHLAHIFSSIGDQLFLKTKHCKLRPDLIGIACDGTGYGFDGKIWGGEIFGLRDANRKLKAMRVGHLENQVLIGGQKAIEEPARVIIAILSRFLAKDAVYKHVKKYYSADEFEVISNQLKQDFNCIQTSSTARILDAASLLLGFCKNERLSKHGPVELLEKNSAKPYPLKPVIGFDAREKMHILRTTPLFEFLTENAGKDKKRLAATAQRYIAEGLCMIVGAAHQKKHGSKNIFFSGGMAANKIMSRILEAHGAYISKKIPCSDAGISFGQIAYFLLADPGNHLSARHFNGTE